MGHIDRWTQIELTHLSSPSMNVNHSEIAEKLKLIFAANIRGAAPILRKLEFIFV